MGIKHSFSTAVDNESTISSVDWNADHIADDNWCQNLNADLLDGLNTISQLSRKIYENDAEFPFYTESAVYGKTFTFAIDTSNISSYSSICVSAYMSVYYGTAYLGHMLDGSGTSTLTLSLTNATGTSYAWKTGKFAISTLATNQVHTIRVCGYVATEGVTEGWNSYYMAYVK